MSDISMPAILVVGGSGVGKRHVAGKFCGSAIVPDESTKKWYFDTKYYSASAEISIARVSSAKLQRESLEAVVLVFDRSDETSFRQVASFWETLEIDEDAVRVLVGNDPTDSTATATWTVDVQRWCADQLVEYVEVGHGDAHDEGSLRLIEALHAHRWPGMTLKSRKSFLEQSSTQPPDDVLVASLLSDAPLDDGDEVDNAFAAISRMKTRINACAPEQRKNLAARQMEQLLAMLEVPDDDSCSSTSS